MKSLSPEIVIDGHAIGDGHACFVIAEVGVNHNGDVDTALAMIDAIAAAGADCVKFQTFSAEEFVNNPDETYEYISQGEVVVESQLAMFKRLELKRSEFSLLFARAREKGLIPLSTPTDRPAVDLLEDLGTGAFKIGSDDLVHTPFLEYVASKGKPVIISTGMADGEDIERALDTILGAGNDQVCILHCVSLYPTPDAEPEALDQAVGQIAADTSLREVILSGGDPLMLDDCRLAELAQRLARIGHLRRLRVHTRMPIVIPQRVTPDLVAWLRGTRLAPIMVVHVNHPAEIDPAAANALSRLADAGIAVLSQTVLLREVNDRADILAELCERLVDLRVMPYYLHQLDRVAGAAHFEVSESRGRELVAELRARLPGYAVPRYVREIPDATSKITLA